MFNQLIPSTTEQIDAGLAINAEHGYSLYQPGEMVQVHFQHGALEIWAMAVNRFGLPTEYHLAFGPNPGHDLGPALTHDQAVEKLENYLKLQS